MDSKERKLYDSFVDVLADRLDNEPSAQDLAVILNFLKYNNIQATKKHKGVADLTEKFNQLPFEDDDEQPLRRIK
jgi:hypothetical protein